MTTPQLKTIRYAIILCILGVAFFYSFSQYQHILTPETQVTVAKEDTANSNVLEIRSIEQIQASELSAKSVVDATQGVYTEAQKSKRVGYLWVDRITKQYVVTLGAINGLLQGSKLAVYHNQEMLGEVEVDVAFDSIAYVTPLGDKELFKNGDYYKVVVVADGI